MNGTDVLCPKCRGRDWRYVPQIMGHHCSICGHFEEKSSDLSKLNRYMGWDDAAQFTTPIGESEQLLDSRTYLANEAVRIVEDVRFIAQKTGTSFEQAIEIYRLMRK